MPCARVCGRSCCCACAARGCGAACGTAAAAACEQSRCHGRACQKTYQFFLHNTFLHSTISLRYFSIKGWFFIRKTDDFSLEPFPKQIIALRGNVFNHYFPYFLSNNTFSPFLTKNDAAICANRKYRIGVLRFCPASLRTCISVEDIRWSSVCRSVQASLYT